MAVVTNLANTTWVFHEVLESFTTDHTFTLNFTCNNYPGIDFTQITVDVNDETGDSLIYSNGTQSFTVQNENTGWVSETARTITIKPGASAEDTATITFMVNNAIQKLMPDSLRKIIAPFTYGQKLYLGAYTNRVLYDGNATPYEDKNNLTEILDFLANLSEGALGKTSGGGYYSPNTMQPGAIGANSLLITEANNLSMGAKSLAIVTGQNFNIRSAAAGSTTYTVSANTYENRIKIYGAIGGVACLNEANAKHTVSISSITVNGSSTWTPDDSADGDIVITLAESINPETAITSIRLYSPALGFSALAMGQGAGNKLGNGCSATIVQGGYNGGNASIVIGASMYNTGNGAALFGRNHINTNNRAFLAGTGHNTKNGPSENATAFGQYSIISNDTAFVIGNGTSSMARSNLFEIKLNGDIYINGVKKVLSDA